MTDNVAMAASPQHPAESDAHATWAERLLHPRYALRVFCAALLIVYALVPLGVYATSLERTEHLTLALITVLAVAAMVMGSKFPYFDKQMKRSSTRLVVDQTAFIAVTWTVFLLFVLVTVVTAPSIPIVSALQGADPNTLSEERGDFLKRREGAGIALLYISTFLVNTVVPYTLVLLYARQARLRHAAAATFFMYCISFMQKALFLNLVLPLLVLLAIRSRLRGKTLSLALVFSTVVLFGATALSVADGPDASSQPGNYLSAQYEPTGPLDYFIWRAVAVPTFTATDSLVVHRDQFGGHSLHGATSNLLSWIFNLERVNIERFVFEHQFGSWNEIANANAVFTTDAYVNFGWLGVVVFGIAVGMLFRLFRRSDDVGIESLWPLFAFSLFSGPFIGTLLSNGFIYVVFHALFVRVKPAQRRRLTPDANDTACP
ncbi:O-antigen polymerase [Ramlibacter sp. AN1015]|uniref:O-antigen polymerase n=1 Tax=Ramlibacter sp. AN1015 TaxID=3133428 RepID=UPI0030C5969F